MDFKISVSSSRRGFEGQTKSELEGIVVLPKQWESHLTALQPSGRWKRQGKGQGKPPLVIYLHGSGDDWLTSGHTLRQFAELGMAAVDFDYTQSSDGTSHGVETEGHSTFDVEFSALLDYVAREKWGDTNSVAWVGFGLGAQNLLRYALKHLKLQPQLLIGLSGGWINELEDPRIQRFNLKAEPTNSQPRMGCLVLLVQGETDETFPVDDAKRVERALKENGVQVKLRVLPAKNHTFDSDRALVIRAVAEYCRAKLIADHPLWVLPRLDPSRSWIYVLPAIGWGAMCWWLKQRWHEKQRRKLNKWGIGLWLIALVFAMLATAETAIHLITPRLSVSKGSLQVTRGYLIPPKWREDFDALAAQPVWEQQKVKTLLTHVEISQYTVRQLINWKVDSQIYRDYVLSPIIAESTSEESVFEAHGSGEFNWRRELWEKFWPRVRHEDTAEDAAAIVVRFLRECLAVVPNWPRQYGVESIWTNQIANIDDFHLVYVAALRSVGVPARLATNHRAEFWNGNEWHAAPCPLIETLLSD
jgi:dienelactone hydrolase